MIRPLVRFALLTVAVFAFFALVGLAGVWLALGLWALLLLVRP